MKIWDYIDTDILQEKSEQVTIDDILAIACGEFRDYENYVEYVKNYNAFAKLKNNEMFGKIDSKFVVKGVIWVYRNILSERVFNYIIQKRGSIK